MSSRADEIRSETQSFGIREYPPLAEDQSSRILNSWKEIASYLGRGVRTVQRWEQNCGLPVHRPNGRERSSTVALSAEIDEWLRQSAMRSRGNGNGNGATTAGVQNSSSDVSQILVDAVKARPTKRQRDQVILSVDDEPGLLFVREKLLELEGYSVLSAPDGEQALAIFAVTPVDLVLLDYKMPGLDGGIVAKRMKAQKPNVPIVMVSANFVSDDTLKYVERLLPKGEGPAALLAAITEILAARAAVPKVERMAKGKLAQRKELTPIQSASNVPRLKRRRIS